MIRVLVSLAPVSSHREAITRHRTNSIPLHLTHLLCPTSKARRSQCTRGVDSNQGELVTTQRWIDRDCWNPGVYAHWSRVSGSHYRPVFSSLMRAYRLSVYTPYHCVCAYKETGQRRIFSPLRTRDWTAGFVSDQMSTCTEWPSNVRISTMHAVPDETNGIRRVDHGSESGDSRSCRRLLSAATRV